MAFFIISGSFPNIATLPSSSISIETPVSSIIAFITFPAGPISPAILEGSIFISSIFGAFSATSGLGSLITDSILSIMNILPSSACFNAISIISLVIPSILISICIAVIPFLVPATLKSISPR